MPIILPACVVLIGLSLRLVMLGVDVRFHPDEALFAAQARLISQQGDWNLHTTDLDKPPLTLYVTALSFEIFGSTETAARLPNVIFSSLSIVGLYALTRTLYQDQRTAFLSALLLAVCPYDLAFSVTVFTDVQATFWTLIAAWLAARERWRGAGLATALIFASKPNALLFCPLIIALGITCNVQMTWTLPATLRRLWRWAGPCALGIGTVAIWDWGRAPRSFLDLGYQRNNPGRFIRSDELVPRLEQWWHWLTFITGSETVLYILLAGMGVVLCARLRCRSRLAALDWQIAMFGIAFLVWYWLIAFNTYDRYLHTLVPFALVLGARTVIGFGDGLAAGWLSSCQLTRACAVPVISAALIGVMLPSTIMTLRGAAKIGGDQGKHTGIDELAMVLNTTFRDEIIYDHWLGWELAYYLGPTPAVQPVYQSLPEVLAEVVRQQATTGFLVAPSPAVAAPWLAALHRANITTSIVYHQQFVIYALEPAQTTAIPSLWARHPSYRPVYSMWVPGFARMEKLQYAGNSHYYRDFWCVG